MIADSLRKIEREIDALVLDTTSEHPVDLHRLHVIARRIGAQAEMLEQGLDTV